VAVQRDNPYANYNFSVDIGLGDNTWFAEVEIPAGEIEVIEYREGADRTSATRKLPGRVSYGNVVLRRGISGRTELFEWWKAVRDGTIDRRNVVITLHDEQQNPVQRWLLRNAWPTKYDPSDLKAKGNEIALETLELAVEGLELD
jgi:phage tail-like protein